MKNLRVVLSLWLLLFASTAQAGWLGDWLGMDDVNKRLVDLNNQVQETRKGVITLGYDAVPGAWWNKLVRDLNSNEPNDKRAAQDFLRNIAKIDIDTPYEGRIWFGMPKDDEIEFDFFFAGSPTKVEVERYLVNKSYTDRYTKSNVVPPLTGDDERKRVGEVLKNTFNQAFQVGLIPNINATWPDYRTDGMTINLNIQPVLAFSGQTQASRIGSTMFVNNQPVDQFLSSQKAAVVSTLANGVMSALYPQNPIVATNLEQRHVKPFNPTAGTPYLFVLLKKKQWEKYKDSADDCRTVRGDFPKNLLCINVVLNKTGSPDVTHHGMQPYTFSMSEFGKESYQHPKHDNEQLVFAVHNMIDSLFLDVDQLNRLKKLQDEFDKWKVAGDNRPAN